MTLNFVKVGFTYLSSYSLATKKSRKNFRIFIDHCRQQITSERTYCVHHYLGFYPQFLFRLYLMVWLSTISFQGAGHDGSCHECQSHIENRSFSSSFSTNLTLNFSSTMNKNMKRMTKRIVLFFPRGIELTRC